MSATASTITAPTTTPSVDVQPCDSAQRVTKSLLGYGILAGPLYLVVLFTQALTRDGFDLTRHAGSLLSNGALGWIQIANFLVCGAMVIAAAVGIRRVLRAGRAATWGPRAVAAYGVGLVAAGIFRADPSMGFPAGAPAGVGEITWHGALHGVAAAVGFTGLIAACFVIGRRFAAEGRRDLAVYSRITGTILAVGFVAIASGSGSAAVVVPFTCAVILGWAWVSAVAAHFYRRANA